MKLDRFITSATDLFRRMGGARMLGGSVPGPLPEDIGVMQLGMEMERMVSTEGWKALQKVLEARQQAVYQRLTMCKEADLRELQVEARIIGEMVETPHKWIEDGKEAAQRIRKANEEAQKQGAA